MSTHISVYEKCLDPLKLSNPFRDPLRNSPSGYPAEKITDPLIVKLWMQIPGLFLADYLSAETGKVIIHYLINENIKRDDWTVINKVSADKI